MRVLRDCGIVESAMYRMESERGAGHSALVGALRGVLDTDCLERALHSVCRMYPVLNSSILECDGTLRFQVLGDDPGFTCLDHSLAIAPALAKELNCPFTAKNSGAIRVCVYAPDDDGQWTIAITSHHAVADGGSMKTICGALLQLYDSYLDGDDVRVREEEIARPIDSMVGEHLGIDTDRALEHLAAAVLSNLAESHRVSLGPESAESNVATIRLSNSMIFRLRRYELPTFALLAVAVSSLLGRVVPWAEDAVLDCGMTVDVRRRLPSFQPLGPTIGAFHSGVLSQIKLADSIREAAGALRDDVELQLQLKHPELGTLCQSVAVDLLLGRDLAMPPLSVGDMGRSEWPQFNNFVVSELCGGLGLHGLGGAYLHIIRHSSALFATLVYPAYFDSAVQKRGLPPMATQLENTVAEKIP